MTTAGTPLEPPARWSGRTGRIRSLARARPVATFVAIVLAIAWPAFIIPLLVGAPLDPSKLLVTLVVMLATATLITSWTEGRAGVRALFGGVTRWRIGVAGYLLVLGAMPVLTLAVAAVTGTLQSPEGGWVGMIENYLFTTVIYGALILNLWEETAWAGFVQSRLMARRGLLVGSLLTAVPFVAIHLPLSFEDAGSAGSVATNLALLVVVAVFVRYLIGTVLVDTGGSVLAVGLLHAAFNASGGLAAVDGQLPSIAAVVVLTLLVAIYRTLRGRSPLTGYAPELLPPSGRAGRV